MLKSRKNKKNIISIDGGGIRGIIPAVILKELEKCLQKYKPHAKLGDYFDVVAGTSVGSIIAGLLAITDPYGKAKYSANQIAELFITQASQIFNETFTEYVQSASGWNGPMYSSRNLEKLLEDELGNLRISQLKKDIVIPTTNLEDAKVKLFTREGDDFYLKDVIRASTAAPTYFAPAFIDYKGHSYVLVDGGVLMNNPAMAAYAYTEKKGVTNVTLISISCGNGDLNYASKATAGWGKLHWIVPLINLQITGGALTVHDTLMTLFSITGESHYVRMNPKLVHAKPDMDNTSAENILNLVKDAEDYVKCINLDEIVKMIL